MLRLWLLRHAKSAWDDPELDDFARPLSPRGKKACRALARHMGERALQPDLVLCSPSTRTRQTWERLEKRLTLDRPPRMPGEARARFEPSLYLAESTTLLALVRATPTAVRELMLIGHNPGLEDFARELTGTSAGDALSRLTEKYPTGGLAELTFSVKSWGQVTPKSGFLASFVVPAQLEG
ncbi:histidine phosphatase family protein [Ferrovibrio terrae]|uniref:SixA phosphatase family protein n=1 Tax=Ferrovibrio terrae TaxID=2594003 RepID=UPI0031381AFC